LDPDPHIPQCGSETLAATSDFIPNLGHLIVHFLLERAVQVVEAVRGGSLLLERLQLLAHRLHLHQQLPVLQLGRVQLRLQQGSALLRGLQVPPQSAINRAKVSFENIIQRLGVADPKFFGGDPVPTCQVIKDSDPTSSNFLHQLNLRIRIRHVRSIRIRMGEKF